MLKFFRDYGLYVYLPLVKQKNMDIVDQTLRADFNQAMFLKQQENHKYFKKYKSLYVS